GQGSTLTSNNLDSLNQVSQNIRGSITSIPAERQFAALGGYWER
ncbi:hypothetical protein NPIL_261891, partial [Nephila pilipes]